MNKHLTGVALVAIVIAGILTACSPSSGGDQPVVSLAHEKAELSPKARAACEAVVARTVTGAGTSIVLVVDATASMADMPLPQGLLADLRAASRADGSLSVIAVDGVGKAPRLVAKNVALSTPGPRDRPSVVELAEVMPSCVRALYGDRLTPTAPGTDLHRAIALAAELVGKDSTLWVVSDWLSNTGPLRLDADLLAEQPERAGATAARQAPVDLAGATLKTAGVANASVPMLAANRTWMRDFTRSLCGAWKARGCEAIALDPVNPERAAKGLPKDAIPTFPGVTTSSVSTGCTVEVPASLAFEGGSAVLGPGAGEVLAVPLRTLRDHDGSRASIVGHTASSAAYTRDQLLRLSRQRAEAVKTFLVRGGIEAGRITARGVGDTRPRVEDIDHRTGRQIPRLAASERRVDIVVGGAPCSR